MMGWIDTETSLVIKVHVCGAASHRSLMRIAPDDVVNSMY
jgi:hypothetical protein